MAARNVANPDTITLTPNGLDADPVTTSSSTQTNPADIAGFVRSIIPRPASLRSDSGPHLVIPAHLSTSTANRNANFLDFPVDIPSADEDKLYYCGVLKSLGSEEEKTAVVTTLSGCEVACSTEGCQGMGRLHFDQLVQICYHKSGEDEGKTFIVHVAAECTPMSSLVASRVGSRAPTRPPTPAGS